MPKPAGIPRPDGLENEIDAEPPRSATERRDAVDECCLSRDVVGDRGDPGSGDAQSLFGSQEVPSARAT
eukprot:2283163-Rhodomonas_salina.2